MRKREAGELEAALGLLVATEAGPVADARLVGARLFMSSRTAKYHLSNVFTKLGISSRAQLRHVLPADPGTIPPRLSWPISLPGQHAARPESQPPATPSTAAPAEKA